MPIKRIRAKRLPDGRLQFKLPAKKGMLIITAGIENVWAPNAEEFDDIVQLITQATKNQDEAVVVLRSGIKVEHLTDE